MNTSELQTQLMALGNAPGPIDGQWGRRRKQRLSLSS
ncbi:peptidoglycan-binding domain-containing protein [Ancylobacter sonchi]